MIKSFQVSIPQGFCSHMLADVRLARDTHIKYLSRCPNISVSSLAYLSTFLHSQRYLLKESSGRTSARGEADRSAKAKFQLRAFHLQQLRYTLLELELPRLLAIHTPQGRRTLQLRRLSPLTAGLARTSSDLRGPPVP